MLLGLRELKLAPDHFWQMTLFELATALGCHARDQSALTRAEMEAMIRASGEK